MVVDNVSFGLISTFISSPIPTPCEEDVVNKATLSCTLKIERFSLKDAIETIFEPVVLIKLELVKNKVVETVNVPVKTFILTLFWSIVVSSTSPVATAAAIPSLKDKVAPLVYDDLLSRIKLSTLVFDDSTSVLLKVLLPHVKQSS